MRVEVVRLPTVGAEIVKPGSLVVQILAAEHHQLVIRGVVGETHPVAGGWRIRRLNQLKRIRVGVIEKQAVLRAASPRASKGNGQLVIQGISSAAAKSTNHVFGV